MHLWNGEITSARNRLPKNVSVTMADHKKYSEEKKLPTEKCFLVDAKLANIFGWLEYFIMTSQPYSFLYDKVVKKYSI